MKFIKTIFSPGDSKKNYNREVKKLIKQMDDDTSKKQARIELIKLGDFAVEPLILVLQNEEIVLRRKNAIELLREINNPKAIDAIIQALKDEESIVNISRSLAEYLVHGKAQIDKTGIDNMKSHYGCSEEEAISLINKAIEVQSEIFDDEDIVDLVDYLSKLLIETNWPKLELTVGCYATKALSEFESQNTIEHLESVLKNENKLLSWYAENAIKTIKNENGQKTNSINETEEPQLDNISEIQEKAKEKLKIVRYLGTCGKFDREKMEVFISIFEETGNSLDSQKKAEMLNANEHLMPKNIGEGKVIDGYEQLRQTFIQVQMEELNMIIKVISSLPPSSTNAQFLKSIIKEMDKIQNNINYD